MEQARVVWSRKQEIEGGCLSAEYDGGGGVLGTDRCSQPFHEAGGCKTGLTQDDAAFDGKWQQHDEEEAVAGWWKRATKCGFYECIQTRFAQEERKSSISLVE